MSELKTRLQSAEKQLQNEQQLLHSILEKVIKKTFKSFLKIISIVYITDG